MQRSDLHPEDDGLVAEIVHWQPTHGHPRPRIVDRDALAVLLAVAAIGGVLLGLTIARRRAREAAAL